MSPYPADPITHHPLSAQDASMVDAMRAQSAPFKGAMFGPLGREPYDAIMSAVAAAPGVTDEPAMVGGVGGFWCRPLHARAGVAILFLHGGGYVMGSAQAYRHFAGQFAQRMQADVFVADYRLGPEHPFPAAIDDARAAYLGLVNAGAKQIIVIGDSAGGGLSLALLSALQTDMAHTTLKPTAAVVMSPWTDLGITGASATSKEHDELYLSKNMVENCAAMYLGGAQATHPQASPLHASLTGLPPLQIHVGTSEVLLDDSLRYAQRAQDAGVDAALHVWEGMPHVFPNCPGVLQAADQALEIMAAFVTTHLNA